jgi:hypothetical protein
MGTGSTPQEVLGVFRRVFSSSAVTLSPASRRST